MSSSGYDPSPTGSTCVPDSLLSSHYQEDSKTSRESDPSLSSRPSDPALATESDTPNITDSTRPTVPGNTTKPIVSNHPSQPTSSIFSRSESAPIHNVPMSVIRRPFPSELDEGKVQTFMAEMQVCPSIQASKCPNLALHKLYLPNYLAKYPLKVKY